MLQLGGSGNSSYLNYRRVCISKHHNDPIRVASHLPRSQPNSLEHLSSSTFMRISSCWRKRREFVVWRQMPKIRMKLSMTPSRDISDANPLTYGGMTMRAHRHKLQFARDPLLLVPSFTSKCWRVVINRLFQPPNHSSSRFLRIHSIGCPRISKGIYSQIARTYHSR